MREEGRIRVADIGGERRVARDGIQWIGHGALVCPGCGMPVVLAEPVSIAAALSCGYCDREAAAREFVVNDVFDTVANEVYLIARVA